MDLKLKNAVAIFLALCLVLSGCSKDAEVDSKDHLVDIFTLAFDTMMENDEALNHNAKYISIDMNHLTELTEDNNEDILSFFKEKYKVDTMNASFEELKEKGMYNPDTVSLDGVLLKIEKYDFVNHHESLFEGTKYKSGQGAYTCKLIVHYANDEWQMKEFIITSES